jgi:hypothetical protein
MDDVTLKYDGKKSMLAITWKRHQNITPSEQSNKTI